MQLRCDVFFMFALLSTTVAKSLLEQKFIEVKGNKLYFSNIPSEALLPPPPVEGSSVSVDEEEREQDSADVENADDASVAGDNTEALSRTVCIQNVPSEMAEFLEIILTQEKSGGGNIEQLIEDGDNVMVTFEDPEGMSSILLLFSKLLYQMLAFTLLLLTMTSWCFLSTNFTDEIKSV